MVRADRAAWLDLDFYAVLGIAANAHSGAIAQAYRAKANALYPRTPIDPEAAAQYQLVVDAHEVLSNPELRREYDEVRRVASLPPSSSPDAPPPPPPPPQPRKPRPQFNIPLWFSIPVMIIIVFGAMLWVVNDGGKALGEFGETVRVEAVRVRVNGEPYVRYEVFLEGEKLAPDPTPNAKSKKEGSTVIIRYESLHSDIVHTDRKRPTRWFLLVLIIPFLLLISAWQQTRRRRRHSWG